VIRQVHRASTFSIPDAARFTVEMIEAFEISQKRAALGTRYRVGSQVRRKYKLPHSKQQDAGPAAAA
jgi:hypothetical protein